MFRDYYAILDIPFSASEEQIKAAYHKQARCWHPDRNHSLEAHTRMLLINEAFIVLKSFEARERYDREYLLFKKTQQSFAVKSRRWLSNLRKQSLSSLWQSLHKRNESSARAQKERSFESFSYEPSDEILRELLRKAKAKATELNCLSLDDLLGRTKAATKGCLAKLVQYLTLALLITILFIVFLFLVGK